jgi:hypothetical protein
MTMTAREPDRPASPKAGSTVAVVSYAVLGAHAFSFLLGILAALLAQNFVRSDSTTFSTAGLISFLFGIALSAASIVLAIAAITLGKSSEHVMIERSDASIRLQNEVFAKTTEALTRIESSTGVTEKRIEDIISGRAGELSHAIAERLGGSGAAKGKTREMLEQEIKESLIGQLSESRALEMRARSAEAKRDAEEAEKHYRKFQSDLLVAVASSQFGKCEKVGEGHFSGEGPDLFDSVITINGERIGISAFGAHHVVRLDEFIASTVQELAAGRFQRVIMAIDRAVKPDGRYRTILHDALVPMRPDLAERFELFDGADDAAIALVLKRLHSLAEGTKAPTLHIAPVGTPSMQRNSGGEVA